MTIDEAIAQLQQIQAQGCGSWLLQILHVEGGIPFPHDVEFDKARDYDGDRVWIWETEKHLPDWATGQPDKESPQ